MKKGSIMFLIFTLSIVLVVACDGIAEHIYPVEPPTSTNKFDEEVEEIIEKPIQSYKVFNAGDDGVNVYRIPTLITTKDGSLLAVAEARRSTWRDKSPTDLALKRSTDNGKTWSPVKFLTDEAKNNFAYMDPCLLVDYNTGKIFLFACRWPVYATNTGDNLAMMLTSTDDGQTWSKAENVSNQLIPVGGMIHGFGPGAGLQMRGDKYKDRLVIPIRLISPSGLTRNRAVFSDNGGDTWVIGGEAPRTGEFEITETPNDGLYYNLRMSGMRASCYSSDGGVTWGADLMEPDLVTIEKGCQSSVIGDDKVLIYTGIYGATPIAPYDDRSRLMIYRSTNAGDKWGNRHLLYEKAAGYSSTAKMANGDLAILFEAGDESGFTRNAERGAGWMRLDLMVLPSEVFEPGLWFNDPSN